MRIFSRVSSEKAFTNTEKPDSPLTTTSDALFQIVGHSKRLVLLLVAILFLTGGAGSVARFLQARNARQQEILYHHHSALLRIEAEIKSAINTVNGLKAAAEAYYATPNSAPSPYYDLLVDLPEKGG